VDSAHIRALLNPFLSTPLNSDQLRQISIYIDLLLRWNARVNLTAIRTPDEIVTRHFGESFFLARHLLPSSGNDRAANHPSAELGVKEHPKEYSEEDKTSLAKRPAMAAGPAVDLGSGAGFPGIPLKIWSPGTRVTLIEANQKKVAFLREVIRALTLTVIDVFSGRAEDYPAAGASLVTLRAVERFASVLPTAGELLAPEGRLALLIGRSQVDQAESVLPSFQWSTPVPIPESTARALLIGTRT
jgi:16S rRNA (guanine527-N7)-methyltransferase